MDTIQLISQMITSLGFPIVAAVALFWYVNKKDEQHRDEMQSLRSSLDKNSSVLDELKGLITYLVGELKNDRERSN